MMPEKKLLVMKGDRGERAMFLRDIGVIPISQVPHFYRRLRGGREERIYRTGDLGRVLPDGCLLHLGRKDFSVKIRGYHVEIDEIETALRECPGIKEAVVIARG